MDNLEEKACRNCEQPIQETAAYCPACGQKYTTGKIPVKTFIEDAFSQYLNLDSRLFRTLAALAIPGKLTTEYFKGKHKQYAKPLQLFLVPAVFLFALISWNLSNTDLGDNAIMALKEDLDWIDFYNHLDTAKIHTDSLFSQQIAHDATDSLMDYMKLRHPLPKDTFNLNLFDEEPDTTVTDSVTVDIAGDDISTSFMVSKFNISKKDLFEKKPKELVDDYGKNLPFAQKILFRQAAKLKQGGRGVIEYFFGKMSLALLVMMPFLALILKLLYIRRKHYFVEHLVFNFHFHAFVFSLLLILGLLQDYVPWWVIVLTGLGILVYLYLAMRRVYGQGRVKTFIKFGTLLTSYFLLSIMFIILTFAVSFLLF